MKQAIYFILVIITIVAVYYGIKTHLYSEGEIVTEDYEVKGTIKSLNIEAALMDVRIDEGDEVKITYKGDERIKPTYDFDEASGTLTIKQKKDKSIKSTNLKTESKLTIELPSELAMDKFKLELAMGNLKVDEIIAKELTISDNMGNIEIEKTSADSVNVEANMGNVVIRKCKTTNIDVKAAMGNVEIKLEDDIKDYTIDAETSLGSLTIGKESLTGSYKQTGTKGNIKVECNLGDVEIK